MRSQHSQAASPAKSNLLFVRFRISEVRQLLVYTEGSPKNRYLLKPIYASADDWVVYELGPAPTIPTEVASRYLQM